MIFSGETSASLDTAMRNLSHELVTDPAEMLHILRDSKSNGRTVGIQTPVLGKEIYVTAVEDIVYGAVITIVLKRFDITGYILETNKLTLDEIESVIPFKSSFRNPFMREVRYKD